MKQNADLFEGVKIEACGEFCTIQIFRVISKTFAM